MKRSLKKRTASLLVRLLTGATLITVLLLWLSAYSSHPSPEHNPVLPVLGLMFPFFAAGNVLLLLLWLAIDRRRMLLPLAGLLCCASDLRSYCPVNAPSPHPKDAIKILSYNCMSFGAMQTDGQGENAVMSYILSSGADIVCLQEGEVPAGTGAWKKMETQARKTYPHIRRTPIEGSDNALVLLSRFPVVGAVHEIAYPHDVNGSVAYRLLLAPADTLLLVNNHFQSNHLSMTERGQYKQMIKNPDRSDIGGTSRFLASKIGRAGSRRAVQVDSVLAFLDRHRGMPTVVVGDFNDTPISYAHRRFALRLTDAHTATATGPGFSFNRDGIFVRIDNIFCSSHFKPSGCRVDRSIRVSDHFPIYCHLSRR